MRSKRSFSFRADQPQPGTRDYFCRFLLFEETYDSADDARNRLANLHIRSPDATAEVNEYDRVMRSGFRVGTVVYLLQTDAITFWEEVQRFAKELFGATPGAELTRAIINAPAEQFVGHLLIMDIVSWSRRVVGFAWYGPAQWQRVRDISSDADDLEDTCEEWLRLAEQKLTQLKAGGLRVEKVEVDSEQLILWCNERGLEINAQARSRYAAEKLCEMDGDQS
jgi:hypothetical protein